MLNEQDLKNLFDNLAAREKQLAELIGRLEYLERENAQERLANNIHREKVEKQFDMLVQAFNKQRQKIMAEIHETLKSEFCDEPVILKKILAALDRVRYVN